VKTKLAATALAATLALAAAACGSDATPTQGPAELRYAIWSADQQPAMQKVVDEFQTANPNIKVKIEIAPWTEYWTKLQVSATGGTAPDAFWMLGDRFQVYAANGQLLPLDDAIKASNVDMSVYPPALVNLFKYQGKQYGLPKDFDTIGLWYNKKLFDAAGVKHPDASWTWQTVRDTAKKLTDPSKKVYGIAAALDRQPGYYNTIYQAGGEIISADGKKSGYDSAAAAEGIKFWTDLIADGSSPTLQQMSDTEAVAMFEAGTVAMFYSGSYYANRFSEHKELKSNADVAPLPAGKQKATVINGIQNVGYAKTKHPEATRKFLLFLGSKQAAEIQAKTGAVIPAYAGTQKAWVDAMPWFHLQVFLDQVPDGRVFPVSGNTAVWQQLEVDILKKAWTGQVDAATAAKELAGAMNTALAKE
jgi:multiple sugar transport system substrate-binding protein